MMNTDCSRRRFLQAGLAVAASCGSFKWVVAESNAADPVVVGGNRQLLLDDSLLDSARTRDVTLRPNPPRDIQRVLRPDRPWETLGFIFYASVVDDGDELKLFHGSYSYDSQRQKHFNLATSRDGIHWERPQLGLQEFEGSKENNILPIGAVEAGVFLDPNAPAEKRYRLLFTANWPDPAKAGVYVASSPDGIHWTKSPERLLPFIPDSQPSGFWDDRLRKYVIYLRAWTPRRSVVRVEVDDLESPWPYDHSAPARYHWGKDSVPTLSGELPEVMAPDDRDPDNLHLYTSAADSYPFAANAYFAFPAAYLTFHGSGWKSRALSGNDGTFDVQLATSRDGVAWNRWRERYVPAGYYDGLNLRLVSMGRGLVRRGRSLYQYFVGWPYTHGRPSTWDNAETRAEWLKKDLGGIYVAKQRVDGFVSIDAAYTGGVLTTRPLRFQGNQLCLNIDTAGSGTAKVAILDQAGAPIPGFSADDCNIINTDAIDHPVRWRDGSDLRALAERPIRIEISMRNTKLYAFQFVET